MEFFFRKFNFPIKNPFVFTRKLVIFANWHIISSKINFLKVQEVKYTISPLFSSILFRFFCEISIHNSAIFSTSIRFLYPISYMIAVEKLNAKNVTIFSHKLMIFANFFRKLDCENSVVSVIGLIVLLHDVWV